MNISEFDYVLPPALIAGEPVYPRDACKLLVIGKNGGKIDHRTFAELPEILKPTDVLVLNDSKVIPARILFQSEGKNIEIFLTKRIDDGRWLAIGKPGKILKSGAVLNIGRGLTARIEEIRDDGQRVIDFNIKGAKFDKILKIVGSTPLPPYIKNSMSKSGDYQTIYAKKHGSVAAPTAGLHFTLKLMKKLKAVGIGIEFVTLHVGLGTFLPVKTEMVEGHRMHSEYFSIGEDVCDSLNKAKKEGRRIIAVGTTAVRVLESSYDKKNGFKPGLGETDIYIYPGYKWKSIDALITNFHLPKSTLILLVSAFAGRALVMKAYKQAIKMKYRFYSFGDAMLIE